MWREPVTFGGGIMMQKVSAPGFGIRARLEGPGLFPGLIEALFRLGGVEGLFHRSCPVLGRVSLSEWAERGEGAGYSAGVPKIAMTKPNAESAA